MATFFGNRSIKRLAEEENEAQTRPFSGRAKVGPCLVCSDRLKPQQGDSSYERNNFHADRGEDGEVN